MRCPNCGIDRDKVIDSRTVRDGGGVRRRRECEACGERFTTYEVIEAKPLSIRKRDGELVAYNRNKIVSGIAKACEKRSVPLERIQAMTDSVERELAHGARREISTRTIGRLILAQLRDVDEVAYVRFASVYRSFTDLEEFLGLLQSMRRDGKGQV